MASDSKKNLSMVSLTIPIFMEQMLKIFVSSIDTFMLSGFSADAVAAVGMMGQYYFFICIMFNVVCIGTSIVLTQYIGAKKSREELTEIAKASCILITVFSLVITVAVLAGIGRILGCYKLNDNVRQFAHDYFIIFGGMGAFFTAFNLMQSAILRSYGHTKEILVVSIIANIVNVIGNAVTLYGLFGLPVLGVRGVAASSATSQLVSCILYACIIRRKEDVCFSLKRSVTVSKDIFKKILRIGVPTAGENVAYNLAQITIMAMLTTLGTAAMAAQVYTQTLARFVFVFAGAIGSATQIKTGYLVGAKQPDTAYRNLYKYQAVGTALSVSLMILMNIFKAPLIRLFNPSEEVYSIVSRLLLLSIYLEFGRSLNLVSIAGLKGSGDIKFPVLYGMFSMWVIMVLGSYIFGIRLGYGLVGIWLSIGTDEVTRGIVMLSRWKSKKWQTKALV